MGETSKLGRRVRLGVLWVATLLIVAVYFVLPDGDDPIPTEAAVSATDTGSEPRRLELVELTPPDGPAGSAVVIHYVGSVDPESLRPMMGKEELPVLARNPGAIVARLPRSLEPGRVKIRLATADDRTKPFEFRVRAPNWRKRFGNLVGGFALLVFGIGVFARGVREAAGQKSAYALARLVRRTPAALGFGAVLGAFVQSTTAAAGFLAGLVASSLLAVGPAAAAFLGAELGAATVPLLVTGLLDPREGLVAVAIGVLWMALAFDRRASALGRLVLGGGLIAFGLQVLRPGFEPLVSDPALLPLVEKIQADGVLGVATCALLGAVLVAALQSPAPVLLIVLGLAQTTGHWNLRTSLAVLSGSGLGAALGALLTTPAGPRCRRLAELHLLLGAGSTVFTAATVDVWIALADKLVDGAPHEMQWGKRVLLPNLGGHLAVAFALGQLAAALVLLPAVPVLARWLARLRPESAARQVPAALDAVPMVRVALQRVLGSQHATLVPLSELALTGSRPAGRVAEHHLSDAQSAIETLVGDYLQALPAGAEGVALGRVAFGCLQLERSLESLLQQAERLTDSRVADSAGAMEMPPLPEVDETAIRRIQELLDEGLKALLDSLASGVSLDLEVARAREIRTNGIEARARDSVLAGDRDPEAVRRHLRVLELVDAYETAGNQIYRLAEVLSESDVHAAELGDEGARGSGRTKLRLARAEGTGRRSDAPSQPE